jgi:hypothetical protein
MRFLWLLEQSASAFLAPLLFPTLFWPGWVALLLSFTLAFRRRRDPDPPPTSLLWLFLFAIVPIVTLLIGDSLWKTVPVPMNSPWHPTIVTLYALGVIQVTLACCAMWHFRRRLVVATLISLPAALWAAGALFISVMAVTGDWL